MASIFNNLRSFAHGAIPGFGAAFFAPPEIKAPTKRDMKEALAYVDALKSVGQWNINNYNPSWLVTRKGLQIFDQMKRDEQIKAALKFKKDSVLASGWEITSPGDQEEDWEVTRFVKDSLDQMSGGWNQVLVNVLSALDFGYSVGERIYEEQEVGEWKGKLVLTRVQSLKPHYIDFLSDAFGQLQGITQQGIAGAAEPLPPAKFIIYSHAMEFGNFYGVSDLEAAYRPYWTKDNAYKWLAVTLERYGMAPLFALYDPNSYSGGSVEELKKVVKGMQNATMGVIPRATAESLELWSQDLNKGSSELFLKALERFDQHIARALLVPGMIGMSADEGKTGSLARSSSHQDSFMMVVTQLQNSLASGVMNAQVIPQLCDLNFPKLQSYPQFKFMQFTDEQRLEVLNTWAGMVGGKIVNKIEDDETHVRKILGFPENDDPKVIEDVPPPVPGIGVGPDGKPIKMGPDGQPLKLGPDGRPWKDPNAKPLFGKKPNPFEKKFEQRDEDNEDDLEDVIVDYGMYITDDDGNEGRWVTIRGRRVFLRRGESLKKALSRNGIEFTGNDKKDEKTATVVKKSDDTEADKQEKTVSEDKADSEDTSVAGIKTGGKFNVTKGEGVTPSEMSAIKSGLDSIPEEFRVVPMQSISVLGKSSARGAQGNFDYGSGSKINIWTKIARDGQDVKVPADILKHTAVHEYGHSVDYFLGGRVTKGLKGHWLSSSDGFREALRKDKALGQVKGVSDKEHKAMSYFRDKPQEAFAETFFYVANSGPGFVSRPAFESSFSNTIKYVRERLPKTISSKAQFSQEDEKKSSSSFWAIKGRDTGSELYDVWLELDGEGNPKKDYFTQFEQDTGDDISHEIPDAELSEEMRTFAEAHDAVWVEADGQRVAVPVSEYHLPGGHDQDTHGNYAQDDEGEDGTWKTIRGRHVFIREGESPASAIQRSLAATPSVEQVKQKIKDLGARWDYDGNDPHITYVANHVASSLHQLSEGNPLVADVIREGGNSRQPLRIVIQEGKLVTHLDHGGTALAFYDRESNSINVASKLQVKMEPVKLKLGSKNQWDNHNIDNARFHSVLAHELGHAVSGSVSLAAHQKGLKVGGELFDSKGTAYWQKNISWYAGKNYREMMAESFAAYTHPRYAESKGLPKEIVSVFEAAGIKPGTRKYKQED